DIRRDEDAGIGGDGVRVRAEGQDRFEILELAHVARRVVDDLGRRSGEPRAAREEKRASPAAAEATDGGQSASGVAAGVESVAAPFVRPGDGSPAAVGGAERSVVLRAEIEMLGRG